MLITTLFGPERLAHVDGVTDTGSIAKVLAMSWRNYSIFCLGASMLGTVWWIVWRVLTGRSYHYGR